MKETLEQRERPNQDRHEQNLRILWGWYKGTYYENGVPRPNELPPKLRGIFRRIKEQRK